MSAFMVSNLHAAALATYAHANNLSPRWETPADTALALLLENGKSLQYRYEGRANEAEDPLIRATFEFHLYELPDLWHVLSAARCYDYQACEHPGWNKSDAKALCDAIDAHARRALGLTPTDEIYLRPAYNAAPWGLPEFDGTQAA